MYPIKMSGMHIRYAYPILTCGDIKEATLIWKSRKYMANAGTQDTFDLPQKPQGIPKPTKGERHLSPPQKTTERRKVSLRG